MSLQCSVANRLLPQMYAAACPKSHPIRLPDSLGVEFALPENRTLQFTMSGVAYTGDPLTSSPRQPMLDWFLGGILDQSS